MQCLCFLVFIVRWDICQQPVPKILWDYVGDFSSFPPNLLNSTVLRVRELLKAG